jgi:hypothetical protein
MPPVEAPISKILRSIRNPVRHQLGGEGSDEGGVVRPELPVKFQPPSNASG